MDSGFGCVCEFIDGEFVGGWIGRWIGVVGWFVGRYVKNFI